MNAKEEKEIVCPRCLGFIPSNDAPGMYPGAISRADNKTEICSACGTDEAMQDYINGAVTSRDMFPIKDHTRYLERINNYFTEIANMLEEQVKKR